MLVVFLHLQHVEGKYFHTNIMFPFQYGWMGVDLFFVISGVVISIVTEGKFGNRSNATTFLYHRFARIYPTFWFFYFITLVPYLINPLWINAASGHHADLLKSFLLIPNQYDNLVGQAWTLSYELNFYVVFFLLLLLIPERFVPVALVIWGASIGMLDRFFPVPYDHWVLWVVTNPLIFEFLAGCILFRIYRRVQLNRRVGQALVVLALLIFSAVVVWTDYAHDSNSDWLKNAYWLRPCICGLMGALLLLGVMVIERTGLPRFLIPLTLLGDWSYSIYLSHEMFIELISRAANRWLHGFSIDIIVVDVLSLPVVIYAGYLTYTWVEHPVMTFLYKRAPRRVPAQVTSTPV
jgi:exopolysaccharide production protein ExoZ